MCGVLDMGLKCMHYGSWSGISASESHSPSPPSGRPPLSSMNSSSLSDAATRAPRFALALSCHPC